MNLINIQWIPFYILFLMKAFNEKRKVNCLLAGIFLFLAASSSYYYLIYLVVFTLFYLAYYSLCDGYRSRRDGYRQVFASFLVLQC